MCPRALQDPLLFRWVLQDLPCLELSAPLLGRSWSREGGGSARARERAAESKALLVN